MPRIDWLRGATFAHRGLHEGSLHEGGVAENSPSAFRAAIARGLGIECDVQLTRDGGAAVFHDFTLERLTAQQGEVCARTLTEMQQITLKGTSDTILSLGDFLALVDGRVPLLIEVKMTRAMPVAPLCEAVAREVAGYPRAAVMSFDPRVGAWFARHAPQTPRGLVMSNADTPGPFGPLLRHLAIWHAKPDFLSLDIADLPGRFAARQRARGMSLACWTVNTPELLARARAYTDAPTVEGAGVPPA